MTKKIVIGIIITVIISLTSFGAVYAYQKEKSKFSGDELKVNDLNYPDGVNQAGNCYGLSESNEQDCPKYQERVRYNYRSCEQNYQECDHEDGQRNQHQHRYENKCSREGQHDCEENNQYQDQQWLSCL